jgi:hypothetical protein
MKTKTFSRMFPVVLLNAACLLLASGCASDKNVRSYNADYGQHLDCAPNYSIEDVNDTHFNVHVSQGSPSTGPGRIIYMKQATKEVAATEAKRRGWQSWDVNYIEDRDQGWMHILTAEVSRKNPVEPAQSPPANNP